MMSFVLLVYLGLCFGLFFGVFFYLGGRRFYLTHFFPKQFQWYGSLKFSLTMVAIFLTLGLIAVAGYYGLPHDRWNDQITQLTRQQYDEALIAFNQVLETDDPSHYPGYIVAKSDQFPFTGTLLKIDADQYRVIEKPEADGIIEVHQYFAAAIIRDENDGNYVYDLTALIDHNGYALPTVTLDNHLLTYEMTPRERAQQADEDLTIGTFNQPIFLNALNPRAYFEGSPAMSAGRYGMVIYIPKGVRD